MMEREELHGIGDRRGGEIKEYRIPNPNDGLKGYMEPTIVEAS